MTLRFALFLCILVSAKAQSGYPRDNPSNQLAYDNSYNNQGYSSDDEQSNGDEIPGEAGKDYPIYSEVPETSFSCTNQQYPGYYADPEAQCQVFYICQRGGRSDAFLCPNGTIFNQEYLVCDWWYNFDCNRAQELYSVNEKVVRAMEEADARLASQKQGGYDNNAQSGGYQNGAAPSSMYGAPNGNGNSRISSNGNGQGFNGASSRNGVSQSYGTPARLEDLSGNGNGFRQQNGLSQSYGTPARLEDLSNNGNNGFRSQNRVSQNYGAPARVEDFSSNGFGSLPRGYDSAPKDGLNQAYGTPSKISDARTSNGFGMRNNGGNRNGNGFNRNGNGSSKNGNSFSRNTNNLGGSRFNGNAPRPVYGAPSDQASNGYSQYNNNNGRSNGGNNGNSNFGAYRNGLGNGPSASYLPPKTEASFDSITVSAQYGTPNQGNQFNLNQPNAYNANSMDQYNAPSRSYLPS